MASSMEWSSTKNYLLRSGIPLEASVSKILQKLNILGLGEFYFKRDDKFFSIDSWSHFILRRDFQDYLDFNIDFLIECKYRDKNRGWYFIPYKENRDRNERLPPPRHNSFNNLLCFYCDNKFRTSFSQYYSDLAEEIIPKDIPICDKGIEMYGKGFVPDFITESIYQISFATAKRIHDAITIELEDNLSQFGTIIFPIIVTTADLFVLNSTASLEKIKESKEPQEVCKEVGKLLLSGSRSLDCIIWLGGKIKSYNFNEKRFTEKEFFRDFSYIFPEWCASRILVVNYNYLEKVLVDIIKTVQKHHASWPKLLNSN